MAPEDTTTDPESHYRTLRAQLPSTWTVRVNIHPQPRDPPRVSIHLHHNDGVHLTARQHGDHYKATAKFPGDGFVRSLLHPDNNDVPDDITLTDAVTRIKAEALNYTNSS